MSVVLTIELIAMLTNRSTHSMYCCVCEQGGDTENGTRPLLMRLLVAIFSLIIRPYKNMMTIEAINDGKQYTYASR